MKKFGIDNPFFGFMSRLGDLLILNILFVITCIPVVTIGMSCAALYRVALRMARGKSNYVAREYFRACREEWKKSMAIGFLFLATGALLFFDVLVAGEMWSALNVAVGVLILLWAFLFTWAFPLQARFENPVRVTLKNAMYMSVRNLPFTLLMTVLNAVPAVCIVLGSAAAFLAVPIYIVLGFSLTARINAVLLERSFRKYVPEEAEKETETAEEETAEEKDEGEKKMWVSPDNEKLQYSGRIDHSDKSAMCRTDLARLKECMRRAETGGELTLGFFGGSITQDSLATKHENCYAYRVFRWWEETFPKARLHYVNGGIGGTTSHYGVSRAVTDLLMYQPDFVTVDFSVNDEPNEFFQETYEGLIRKILSWPSRPAVILLNNVFYDTGVNAQEYHNRVGEWYGVPHVSIKDTLWQRMKAGEYTRDEFTPDGLHPNDRGHGLVAEEITAYLKRVKEQMWKEETEREFPSAMTDNAYENAKRLTIREICPKLEGFRADPEEKMGHLDHFKIGWIGKRPGDRIRFEVEASCIAVQYRKTVRHPARRAELILDGDREHPVLLDGNFDEGWGDCLYLEPVLHHGESRMHTVEIEVLPDKQEDAEPFYLMALITA